MEEEKTIVSRNRNIKRLLLGLKVSDLIFLTNIIFLISLNIVFKWFL